jgi:uncharacterized protein
MSLRPIKCLLVVGSMLLFSLGPAPAQTPSLEAMSAARSLVTTLKLTEQYKALLPAILLSIKPALTQDRPEIETDFEAKKPAMAEAYMPYYNAMVDAIATVYATNYSVEELRELDAFYRRPTGQKFLEKWPAITQQSAQIGEEGTRKAAEGLRTSLTEVLRQKAPK